MSVLVLTQYSVVKPVAATGVHTVHTACVALHRSFTNRFANSGPTDGGYQISSAGIVLLRKLYQSSFPQHSIIGLVRIGRRTLPRWTVKMFHSARRRSESTSCSMPCVDTASSRQELDHHSPVVNWSEFVRQLRARHGHADRRLKLYQLQPIAPTAVLPDSNDTSAVTAAAASSLCDCTSSAGCIDSHQGTASQQAKEQVRRPLKKETNK